MGEMTILVMLLGLLTGLAYLMPDAHSPVEDEDSNPDSH